VEDFAPLLTEFVRHVGDSAALDEPASSPSSLQPPPVCLSEASLRAMVTRHFDGRIGVHSRDGVGLA